jgi:hypothetical protein
VIDLLSCPPTVAPAPVPIPIDQLYRLLTLNQLCLGFILRGAPDPVARLVELGVDEDIARWTVVTMPTTKEEDSE